ncbi:nucleotidyltransferase family protein [Alicyclobacillus shizuokensis]|uniref:nucleotidyltransferase family protein n=1 Tax=Alicyclobacillus shizuokensis TaxID=392014 RepID=UPI00082A1CF8|nr:nucleotidyltransferase family protein [Alicyclobacillus shizuokensis]
MEQEQMESSSPRVGGIVLAAGLSTRMGRPKPLLELAGIPFVRRVAAAATSGGLAPVVVVVGPDELQVRRALAGLPGIRLVKNPDYASGMASSLATGVREVMAYCDAVMVLLADQPLLPASVVDQLRARYAEERAGGILIVRARYAGQPGHPVLFDSAVFPELLQLQGDVGARSVVSHHASALAWADFANPWWGKDVDTPEALSEVLAACEDMRRG